MSDDRRIWRPRPAAALFLLAWLTAGCGTSMYPVEGKLVWSDGTPATELAGGFVGYSSEIAKVSARGDIQPDGSFTLSSLQKNDGIPAGTYQVIVVPPEPNGADDRAGPEAQGRRLLLRKYQSYTESGLEATVETKRNRVTLTLEKAKR